MATSTVATLALSARRSNPSARSHPHSARCHPSFFEDLDKSLEAFWLEVLYRRPSKNIWFFFKEYLTFTVNLLKIVCHFQTSDMDPNSAENLETDLSWICIHPDPQRCHWSPTAEVPVPNVFYLPGIFCRGDQYVRTGT
jgi:hypothetical protein